MLTASCCMVQDNVVIITGDIHTHWAAEVVEQACKNQTGYGGYEETGADPPDALSAGRLPFWNCPRRRLVPARLLPAFQASEHAWLPWGCDLT